MSWKKRHTPNVDDLRPYEQAEVLRTLAQRADAVGEAMRDRLTTYCPCWQRDFS